MNFVLTLTFLGSLLGCARWFTNTSWFSFFGAGVAALVLFMNLASKVMKFPVILIILMVIAANMVEEHWIVGASVGLLVWTTIDVFCEVVGLKSEGRL